MPTPRKRVCERCMLPQICARGGSTPPRPFARICNDLVQNGAVHTGGQDLREGCANTRFSQTVQCRLGMCLPPHTYNPAPPLNAPSMPPPVHLRYSTPPASPAPPAHPSRPPTSPTPPTPKYTQASAPHSRQKSQVKKTRSFHTSPPYRILLSPVEGRITLKLPTLPYPAAFIAPPAPLAPRYSSPHQWRPSSTQTTTADSRRAT
jgi:hypothetical protein